MDAIHRAGPSSAGEVRALLPDPPSETAVRTLLRILQSKGHLRQERVGTRHVYAPTVARETAQRSALRHLLGTFFGGSPKAAMAALLDLSERDLTAAERRELAAMIRASRERGA